MSSIRESSFGPRPEGVFTVLFLCLFTFGGCGKSSSEKVDLAVETAKIYLTHRQCQEAIEVLEDNGRENKHAKYLQTLSSAYACKSDFTSSKFFGTNLSRINSSLSNFLGSLTRFNTSTMVSPDDISYENLQRAIDILLYAGGLDNPSAEDRATIFSTSELEDIHIQNIFMILTQLGKFLYYYGNADPTNGRKGIGNSSNGNNNNLTNGCFYDYNPSDATLKATIDAARAAGTAGSCTLTASGHEKLPALPDTNTVTRMCQGVVLFNNLVDILGHTTIPNNGEAIKDLYNILKDVCSSISGAGDICNVRSQSICERDFGTGTETDRLEIYFFSIFELLFI